MKLYIPQPGDAVVLVRPWVFTLHPEHRNVDFHRALFPNDVKWGTRDGYPRYELCGSFETVTLSQNTELVFDRVYIRQGADEYASITFIVKSSPIEAIVGERFWSKLDDVNDMDVERTTSHNPFGVFAKALYKKALLESKDQGLAQKNAKKKHMEQASKQALAAAREHVQLLVLNTNHGPIAAHVDRIITESIKAKNDAGYTTYRDNERQFVRHDMTHGPLRRSDPHPWQCKTHRNTEGTVTRELRFLPCFPKATSLGGFQLVMKDDQVLSCELLE